MNIKRYSQLLGISLLLQPAAVCVAQQPAALSLDDLRIPYEFNHERRVYHVQDNAGIGRFLDVPAVGLQGKNKTFSPENKYERRVGVVSGTGRQILKLEPESQIMTWSEGGIFTNYSTDHSPDVHPAQDRIICVRCQSDYRCKLIEVRLDGKGSLPEVIYVPPKGEIIDSPVWSADGRQIAFLIGKDIGIVDRESMQLIHRISIGKTDEVPLYTLEIQNRDYIRWNEDGTRLFLWGNHSGPGYGGTVTDIGELEIASEKFQWLGVHGIDFIYGKSVGRSIYDQVNKRYTHISQLLEDTSAVRALFGSSKNMVLRPIWSPDRRYYFYLTKKEGFLAKEWLERYDAQTEKSAAIKILWRALYVE